MTSSELHLRQATSEDCGTLFEWANDPVARKNSFGSEPILWAEHLSWFSGVMSDSKQLIYIVLDQDDHAVGQVRFELLHSHQAVTSISIAADHRNQGVASAALRLATKATMIELQFTTAHAYIKLNNSASIRAFRRAGYRQQGTELYRDQLAVHLIAQHTPAWAT